MRRLIGRVAHEENQQRAADLVAYLRDYEGEDERRQRTRQEVTELLDIAEERATLRLVGSLRSIGNEVVANAVLAGAHVVGGDEFKDDRDMEGPGRLAVDKVMAASLSALRFPIVSTHSSDPGDESDEAAAAQHATLCRALGLPVSATFGAVLESIKAIKREFVDSRSYVAGQESLLRDVGQILGIGVMSRSAFFIALRELAGRISSPPPPGPIPMLLRCPVCVERHYDDGEFATRPHKTHACQHCGEHFTPALVPTMGVRFLPGCKNGEGAV